MFEISIVEYDGSKIEREQIENFRELSFKEGNDSLAYDKYDPDKTGQTFLNYVDGKLASLSVIEPSHYTGDPTVAARGCRLHIATEFRPAWLGLLHAPKQIMWAKENGFKVFFFTHDIRNRAINAMYQKRRFGGAVTELQKQMEWMWTSDWYQDLSLDRRLLFQVDERSDLLQYVYYWTLEEGYVWKPPSNVVWYDHDGRIKSNVTEKEIINAH
tara:strand:- start:53 stop:694 length:642 start_codon:yes stop_codon:yes gene_type:complete